MEKDKSSNHSGASLPRSGRHLGNGVNVKPEHSSSSTFPPLAPGMSSESCHFSHDISRMPDNPPKKLGHRRAHSEIITLPDDISFDSDLGVVGGLDGPSLSDDAEDDLLNMYLDMDNFNLSSSASVFQVGESSSAAASEPASGATTPPAEEMVPSSSERPRVRHQHSLSMDGSTTIKQEMVISGTEETPGIDAKKAMSAAKIAELALVDPKRAKRILANRQSAARSKERKMRYIAELERKVQALQTEATSLSAQLSLLQRDTNGLTTENSELKLRLQAMEQQVHLQDALNDTLKEEVQHLKVLTGQAIANGASVKFPSLYGANQQFYSNNHHNMHTLLAAQQFQQLQIHPQKQQQHPFQLNQFQQHEQPLQQTGDLRLWGSNMPSSSSQNEYAPDVNLASFKD